ncbi:glycosyltransferase [Acinetobacter indicus]|uniref:glycosyltransferase n=1 Tax=Acinetobacter indicus TaxID=756892 RepID=UPI001D17F966|nr:glycosyltransferase [Acinetobacter indicus]
MLRIKRYISDHNIDICRIHLAFGIIFTALISVPVVYTHHSMEPRWGKLLYQIFNRLMDEYVGISNKCAKALDSYTMRNINTIQNAVSEDKFIAKVNSKDTIYYNGIILILASSLFTRPLAFVKI